MSKPQPDVLTVEEVRKRLRLSRNGVYDAIARREIPSLKFGRRIVVPRVAFEALLRGEGTVPDGNVDTAKAA